MTTHSEKARDAFESELLERLHALSDAKRIAFLTFALGSAAGGDAGDGTLLAHVRELTPQRRFALLAFVTRE